MAAVVDLWGEKVRPEVSAVGDLQPVPLASVASPPLVDHLGPARSMLRRVTSRVPTEGCSSRRVGVSQDAHSLEGKGSRSFRAGVP